MNRRSVSLWAAAGLAGGRGVSGDHRTGVTGLAMAAEEARGRCHRGEDYNCIHGENLMSVFRREHVRSDTIRKVSESQYQSLPRFDQRFPRFHFIERSRPRSSWGLEVCCYGLGPPRRQALPDSRPSQTAVDPRQRLTDREWVGRRCRDGRIVGRPRPSRQPSTTSPPVSLGKMDDCF